MDNALTGAVEVGDPGMTGDMGADLTITVSGGTVTLNGEPTDPVAAMKALLMAIKSAPEGDEEAAFQSGYGDAPISAGATGASGAAAGRPAMNRQKGNGPSGTTDGGGL